ncbi:MAG: M3 family metallopeptidase [Gemmatimonadetes bacterium]|nr:M3 family metallopeptidase [Gemmatimonadota bacterium]MDA1103430.1 M3 family metallopeptidase [Gemmatimonadota bacterium]
MNPDINPLLSRAFRIPFHLIEAGHVEPGIREALRLASAEVEAVASDQEPPTWANTIGRLDRAAEDFSERTGPAGHLIAVAETPELRDAYNAVLPEISAFWASLPLHEALWERIKAFAASDEAAALAGIQKRHLDKTVREFQRAGADLPKDVKKHLESLQVEIAQLQQKFSENVLDATAAFELLVPNEGRLAGVPDAPKRRFRARAQEKGFDGWLLTLDYPSVEPILKHCQDRELRREILVAYSTRCRDGDFDNRGLLARILRLRHEVATLLGYGGFADYVLADRMAGSGARAVAFEAELVERTRAFWERDTRDLTEHARTLGLAELEPWDVSFAMESLRKLRYDIDDEILRPYFPLGQVLAGMFEIVRRAFGFRIQERTIEEVWHADVRFYEIFDEADVFVGAFYTDWFPRKEKRQGAWMNNFLTGGPRGDDFTPHLGVMCGNFTPPEGDDPALLTHREVETTFHEFGHLLHHCTSRVEVPSRAGINVAWDWVELPSQLMENWTWEREALDLFASHHETGESLPSEVFDRMVAARRFMGGWAQMRQLSLGTVDLALHEELAPRLNAEAGASPDAHVDARQGDEVMEFGESRFTPFAPAPGFARLHGLTSFTHLFAGGYAAGYYSYLWSEVLDADVFTRFRDEGIFNRETGRSYVDSILSRGDSADPDALFLEFMGRAPDAEALLERNLGSLIG